MSPCPTGVPRQESKGFRPTRRRVEGRTTATVSWTRPGSPPRVCDMNIPCFPVGRERSSGP